MDNGFTCDSLNTKQPTTSQLASGGLRMPNKIT